MIFHLTRLDFYCIVLNMKILLVDDTMKGHHLYYIQSILTLPHEFVFFSSQTSPLLSCHQIKNEHLNFVPRKFRDWLKFISEVKNAAESENVDCVHFLNGALFYRFFGIGLGRLRKFHPIITFHVIRFNLIRNISLRNIFRNIRFGVTHTSLIEQQANSIGIKNIVHIEYPDFTQNMTCGSVDFPELPKNVPIIAAIGGTRYDKGLDILLEALSRVESVFHLLIAGYQADFDETFIKEHSQSYSENVTLMLKYLSDDELLACYNHADIIVLPYRLTFNGASGPLTEAASRGKCVVGPSHGSLADIIRSNHLGYTFESENADSLAQVLDKALSEPFAYDETARHYRDVLSPKRFVDDYRALYERVKTDSK